MTHAELAEIAHRAATAAAARLNDHYARPESLNVASKADRSPVTDADMAAHHAIAEVLAAATPGIPLLSEENVEAEGEGLRHAPRFWLVDPLDGTREFITRTAEFSVNIALVEEGIAVVGALAVPPRALVAVAWRGGGAHCRHADGRSERLHTRPLADAKAPTVTVSRFHHATDLDELLAPLTGHTRIMLGAGLKWLSVASGEADLYPRLNTRMCEWDIAAGQVLIEEAGGVVLDGQGERLSYARRDDWRVPRFLAYGDRSFDWFSRLGMAGR